MTLSSRDKKVRTFMIWQALRSQHSTGFLPKSERFIHPSMNATNDVADDIGMNRHISYPQRNESNNRHIFR